MDKERNQTKKAMYVFMYVDSTMFWKSFNQIVVFY